MPYNYLYPALLLSLARVYESVLYDQWHNFADAYYNNVFWKRSRSILKRLYKTVGKRANKDHQISKVIYIEIFLHFCLFIGVALCMLLMEHNWKTRTVVAAVSAQNLSASWNPLFALLISVIST